MEAMLAAFAAKQAAEDKKKAGDTLNMNDTLLAGKRLDARNFHYHARLNEDGNLVVVKKSTGKTLWTSGGGAGAGCRLDLQSDFNLVIYTPDRKATWASGTAGGRKPPRQASVANGGPMCHRPIRLVMQDDGNLVLYDANNFAMWASGTSGQ